MPRTDDLPSTTQIWMAKIIAEKQAEAVAAERARIKAGVVAATEFHHPFSEDVEEGWMIGREEILRIVEGETPDGLRGDEPYNTAGGHDDWNL